ncbi:MAG: TlpA disulfide reductase family protein [Pseudomonadota bacterium]
MYLGQTLVVAVLTLSLASGTAAAKPAYQVGDVAPETLGYTTDKAPIMRADYEGAVIVLTFWATWCAPCLKELPILNAMAEMTDESDLKVISVGFKQTRATTKRVIRKLDGFDVLFSHDKRGKLAKAFKIKSIPNLWIIDRSGRIVYQKTGYTEAALPGLLDIINAVRLGIYTLQ